MGFFDWYRLFNQAEFLAQDIVSFNGTVNIEGVGQKDFMILKGNLISVSYEDVFLPINMNNKNPFRFGERAIFIDELGDVWLGIYREN